ncbi:uncharacterized protein IWZ02DRAFT_111779 [Phyllosticta citriasiana]|uniref:T6SS Phospholipase effector Tle1-like catalytic domain-containing protein n=1 Tax=Phyllosticta citriasiana TaxID=595635 RepID=A0ABR1KCT2_9PEZI
MSPEDAPFTFGRSSRGASPRGDAPFQPAQLALQKRGQRKFVLCFDGTGNKFSGTNSDSNILKIYRMLDRGDGSQFHYYQPGIGTYVTTGSYSHTSHYARFKSWYLKAKDSAIGTSFAEHVMGGYKFLMRYYLPGDEIYFFGFSRGAYTARFLAEMLDHTGLLTAGNEEMCRFAWKTFQKWQTRQERTEEERKEKRYLRDFMCAFRETFSRPVRRIRFLGLFDTVNSVPTFENAWMQRSKFPYTARSTARVIRHAVAIDERRAKFRQDLISEVKTTKKRRHHHRWDIGRRSNVVEEDEDHLAVRNKPEQSPSHSPERHNAFNRKLNIPRAYRDSSETSGLRSLSPGLSPTGFRGRSRAVSDVSQPSSAPDRHDTGYDSDQDPQDIQEVWFAGCHADIGGGWPLDKDEDTALSHIPLVWMVREAQRAGLQFDEKKLRALNCCAVDEPSEYVRRDTVIASPMPSSMSSPVGSPPPPPVPPINVIHPSPLNENGPFMSEEARNHKLQHNNNNNNNHSKEEDENNDGKHHKPTKKEFHASLHSAATRGKLHDVLCFNNGVPHFSVMCWNLMEWIPFRRMDLCEDGSWKSITWPLPKGEVRDVPMDVLVHHSVIKRMQHDPDYRPGNLIVGGGGRGVRRAPDQMGMGRWKIVGEEGDPIGETHARA